MYPHTSHHASLPTLESSEEFDTRSHLLEQLINEQSMDVTGLEPDTERLQVQPIKKADTEITPKCIII